MYNFFKSHTAGLAYAGYFNCLLNNNMYTVYPPHHNPMASTKYFQLWLPIM